MTTKIADTSKSLLTHLMVAGTAALAGSAANAQIVVTNVNENIGFAPGDVSSFVSSLPGVSQFEIFRLDGENPPPLSRLRAIRIRSKIVGPPSVGASLQVKANKIIFSPPYPPGGSVYTALKGWTWGTISADNKRSAEVAANGLYYTTAGSTSSNTHYVTYTVASRRKFCDAYFAVRFTDADRGYQLDYGWIKASLTDNTFDGLNLHISSYAYDPTGAQIAMGETVAPVPEPNSALALAALSALTLGAAGVKRFKALQPTRETNP